MPPLEKGFIRGKNPRSHPQVLLEVRILHKIRDKIKIIHNRSLVPINSSNKDPLQIHQVSHTAVVKQQFRVRIPNKVVPAVTEISNSNNNIHRRQLRVRRQLQPPRHQQLKPPRHHTGAASIFLPRRALQPSPLQNLFLAKLILTYKVCKCIQELPGSTPMTPGLLTLMQQLVSTLSNPNTQPQAGHGGTCSHKQPLGGWMQPAAFKCTRWPTTQQPTTALALPIP